MMECEKCGKDSVRVDTHYEDGNIYYLHCYGCGRDKILAENEFINYLDNLKQKNFLDPPEFVVVNKNSIKILCVEDGSVDTDTLEEMCLKLGANSLVYRQGSKPPFILDIGE